MEVLAIYSGFRCWMTEHSEEYIRFLQLSDFPLFCTKSSPLCEQITTPTNHGFEWKDLVEMINRISDVEQLTKVDCINYSTRKWGMHHRIHSKVDDKQRNSPPWRNVRMTFNGVWLISHWVGRLFFTLICYKAPCYWEHICDLITSHTIKDTMERASRKHSIRFFKTKNCVIWNHTLGVSAWLANLSLVMHGHY
jgi:hypothetical protein